MQLTLCYLSQNFGIIKAETSKGISQVMIALWTYLTKVLQQEKKVKSKRSSYAVTQGFNKN